MLRRAAKRDRMVGLFVAGVVLLDPPILNLLGGTAWGWPALFLYLFFVWALLIVGMALINERGAAPTEERTRDPTRR
jgi:O-antigen/teichoic acid export membrane protein